MSIIAYYKQVSPSTLDFILKNPDLLTDFIFDDDLPKQPELLVVLNENDKIPATDTDKAWQGMLFLLNGFGEEEDELTPFNAVLGMEEVSPVEVSVGPAHYLTAEQVSLLADWLGDIDRETLFETYNPAEMAEEVGYSDSMSEDEITEDQNYIWGYYQEMTRYYKDAASRGNAIITYLL